MAACDGDGTAPVGPLEPDTVPISIEMRPAERTVGILGTQFGVRAFALNEGGETLYGSHQDPGRFSWSTSAPDVATIDEETRVVTGVNEGVATITATSQGLTGEMTVAVRDAARLAWSVPTGSGSILAGIAIGADGTVYVVSYQYGTTSRVTALSPQGSVVWTLATSFRVVSTPAIGEDGTLYLGGWAIGAERPSGRLIAVDPDGIIRWAQEDLERIRSSPAVGPDGTIYVAGGHHVYAVDPQGKIQWAQERDHDETLFLASSPAIASDGTIYVGGEDGLLYAINPDGSLRWTFRTGDRIRSSPSIGTDGTIYFGSHDGRLYAISPNGTERWSVELDWRGISSSPSIGPDGTIYVIAGDVFAVESGGSIRWSYPARTGGSTVTPIVGRDGTVYVGAAGDAIHALDAQGKLLWDGPTGRHLFGSPAIGVDGTIFSTFFSGPSVEASEGTVQAIVETESTNGGFEGAPWPTERGDRANTGRAGG